ncbi:MAG: hypothetical protein ACW99F_19445, partial [Candidatus Hodarchaeales archaeon]
GEYIRATNNEELKRKINKFYKGKYDLEIVEKVVPLVKERIKTLGEFENLAGFFFETPKKIDKKLFTNNVNSHVDNAVEVFASIDDWNLEKINDLLMQMIKRNKFNTGKFFMDLRIAITGSKFTPPINESISVLGKKETLERLKKMVF